ncbi:hypothetical protein OQA88_8594 [Cercophora sp. LCS_1]
MAPPPLKLSVERVESTDPKAHHVTLPNPASSSTSMTPSSSEVVQAPLEKILGFKNPWSSWQTPTIAQTWANLSWGQEKRDPYVDLAMSRLPSSSAAREAPNPEVSPRFTDITDWPDSTGAMAARLLRLEKPNFGSAANSGKAKITWLGHAGVLVQLPPLKADCKDSWPVGCLFDPIFSMRCSPSQMAGPIRTYPPPCNVDELPKIDAVFISHNHYDHLDFDTIMALWERHRGHIRFFVPLNNRQWFVDCGIEGDRVVELDWWDSAQLRDPQDESRFLNISCTPAQHSSGRTGFDANTALWSSWFLEYQQPGGKDIRVFFAGDTGFQFHPSPKWPPSPDQQKVDETVEHQYSECPCFADIRDRLGRPNILLLPISVGATFSYLRSLVPMPDWMSPIPRHSPGLTAATHMPAWDAVRVFNLMTERGDDDAGQREDAVAIAMHWGTFVPEPSEVLRVLGQLEWACQKQDVVFVRSLADSLGGRPENRRCFIALNHGQSVDF